MTGPEQPVWVIFLRFAPNSAPKQESFLKCQAPHQYAPYILKKNRPMVKKGGRKGVGVGKGSSDLYF